MIGRLGQVGLQFDPNITASVNGLKGNYLLANANNQRSGVTQEFRLSSAPNQAPVSIVPESRNLDLRLGLERDGYEVNLFVLNATDYRNGPLTGGRSQCLNTACTSYAQYAVFRTTNWGPPRQIGVQLVYRH